jgi:hypothetical protein
MRGDREVADAGPVGQDHRHGRRLTAVDSASAVQISTVLRG